MPDQDESAAPATAAMFAGGAAAGLSQVSGQLSGVQADIASGSVKLSQEAAAALLGTLDDLRSTAADLVDFAATNLDQQLHLGHNWVGTTMDNRLRGAVNGHSGAVQPMLVQFQQLLDQMTATIRQAAGLTRRTDDDMADTLRRAGGVR